MEIALYILCGVITAIVIAGLTPRLLLGKFLPGDTARGVAIFVGGIRWFGCRWGLRSVPAGLARGGFAGQCIHWNWHSAWEGWLGLPAMADAQRFEREARKIADCIAEFRRENPARPIYLLGCSAGGFLALRALEVMDEAVQVDSAALLSPAVDPRRDFSAALAHVKNKLVLACSRGDWIVLGLGTLLFGTADRKHAAAAGMVGVAADNPARSGLEFSKLLVLPWRPAMILSGRIGGHASATPPGFIARYIAPAMDISLHE